jgi:circadian clock protein KaiB
MPGMIFDPESSDSFRYLARNRTRMSSGMTKRGSEKPTAAGRQPAQKEKLSFRLYITRGERASERALANLKTICRDHFIRGYEIEVVDARKHPLRAEKDGVSKTPTLIKCSPAPAWTIVGDLSEDALILAAMKRKRTARRVL